LTGQRLTEGTVRALFSSGGEVVFLVGAQPTGGYVGMVRRYDGVLLGRWKPPNQLVPQNLALLDDSRTLLVTLRPISGRPVSGALSFLSTGALTESGRLEVCKTSPDGIAVMQGGNRAYVRCVGGEQSVVEIDLELRRIVKTVAIDTYDTTGSAVSSSRCGSGGIALSRTGGILFLPCDQSGQLLYLDRLTLELLDSVPVGPSIFDIAISPRRSVAALTNPRDSVLVFLDLAARSVIGRTHLPGFPTAMSVDGNGRSLFISLRNEGDLGKLIRLDMRTGKVMASAPISNEVTAVTLWPGRRGPIITWR
jgi:DNA-binding beta-propeller fold protein YncE